MPSYGLLAQPFQIVDVGELQDLAQILHDETCSVDEAVWNGAARTLLLPVRRQFHGGDEVEIGRGPESITYETSWMRSEVLIRNANSWEKIADQGIGNYSFDEWHFAAGELRIVFHEELNVVISVGSLDITMVDLGFGGKAQIERFIGGSSEGSGEIY